MNRITCLTPVIAPYILWGVYPSMNTIAVCYFLWNIYPTINNVGTVVYHIKNYTN